MSWIEPHVFKFRHNFSRDDYKGLIPIPSLPHDFKQDGRCLFVSLSTKEDEKNSIGQVMDLRVSEDGIYREASYGVTIQIIIDDQTDCCVTIPNGRIPNKNSPFHATFFQGQQVFLNKNVKVMVIFNKWPVTQKQRIPFNGYYLQYVLNETIINGDNGRNFVRSMIDYNFLYWELSIVVLGLLIFYYY